LKRVCAILLILGRVAVRGLRASPVTSSVAVLTIAITLVLTGGFALTVENMQGVLDRFGQALHVTAYLEDEVAGEELAALAESVATIEGVERVEVVSKREALERFRRSIGGTGLLKGLKQNPLPACLEITLLAGHRTPAGLEILTEAITGLPGIDELAHGREWVETYARVTSLLRFAGYGLGVVLGLAALMIVANTIRLAVYAREDEIEILSLVGASRTFVRVPYLIEGTLQGAAGGVLALLVLYLAFRLLTPQIEYGLELLLGNTSPHFFSVSQLLWLTALGAGLGFLGSVTALMGSRAR